jgi:hypothetical protein
MPFAKTCRTELRAVSTNHEECVVKAQKFLRQAEDIGSRTAGRKARCSSIDVGPVPKCHATYPSSVELQTKQEIKLTVQAAEHFRIAGDRHWFDSAKAYAQAAALAAEAQKDPSLAAELFTEAAFVMEKVDSDFATSIAGKAISQHCDATQYSNAARLEERMANNHKKKSNFEASIDGYKRASKLYSAANMNDSADDMNYHAAYLLGKVGRVRDSACMYQSLAMEGLGHRNLTKFNVSNLMLRATVLLLSDCLKHAPELDFSAVRKMVEDTYGLDCRFGESRENKFLGDIMHCIVIGDLDRFSDYLFYFSSLCEFDDLMLDTLEDIKNVTSQRAGTKAIKEQG